MSIYIYYTHTPYIYGPWPLWTNSCWVKTRFGWNLLFSSFRLHQREELSDVPAVWNYDFICRCTADLLVKANQLFPQRFYWRLGHPHLIDSPIQQDLQGSMDLGFTCTFAWNLGIFWKEGRGIITTQPCPNIYHRLKDIPQRRDIQHRPRTAISWHCWWHGSKHNMINCAKKLRGSVHVFTAFFSGKTTLICNALIWMRFLQSQFQWMTQIVSYYCIVDVDFDFILNIYSMHSYIYMPSIYLYLCRITPIWFCMERLGVWEKLGRPQKTKGICINPTPKKILATTRAPPRSAPSLAHFSQTREKNHGGVFAGHPLSDIPKIPRPQYIEICFWFMSFGAF